VSVRRATRADVPAIVRLVRELAAFEKLPGPDDAAAARLADDFGSRYDAWVAEVGGEIVAYAIAFETYGSFHARPLLWLEDVYVTPKARRAGLSRELLEALAEHGRRRGCERMAWAVLDWNVEAKAFYAKIGARRKPWEWHELDLVSRASGGGSPSRTTGT
jgi:GNAT superfamily N-acetyltransferase